MISEEIRRQVLDSQELAIMDIENGHEDPSGLPAKRLREDFELVSDDEEDEAQRERKRERRAKMTKRQVKEREADLDCRVMVNVSGGNQPPNPSLSPSLRSASSSLSPLALNRREIVRC